MILIRFETLYKYLRNHVYRIFDRYRISDRILGQTRKNYRFAHLDWAAGFRTGGKPSTWFPPGGLVEHISDDQNFMKFKTKFRCKFEFNCRYESHFASTSTSNFVAVLSLNFISMPTVYGSGSLALNFIADSIFRCRT